MSAPASTAIRDLLRTFEITPKRSLGQNFITDESYLTTIVETAALDAADRVLEIGPGLGVLTRQLAEHAGSVTAIELDERLLPLLRTGFATRQNISIVHGDILESDPASLLGGASPGGYKVVANLPYYITSPVLRHLLEATPAPELIVVMVQKEVAQRICADAGALSILGVSVQFYAQPELIRLVPADVFYPRPKVDSAILKLTLHPAPLFADVEPERFFRVVRAGFSQKRKQLLNSLAAGLHLSKEEVRTLLESAQVDPRRRAQTLALEEWARVCRAVASLPSPME